MELPHRCSSKNQNTKMPTPKKTRCLFQKLYQDPADVALPDISTGTSLSHSARLSFSHPPSHRCPRSAPLTKRGVQRWCRLLTASHSRIGDIMQPVLGSALWRDFVTYADKFRAQFLGFSETHCLLWTDQRTALPVEVGGQGSAQSNHKRLPRARAPSP